MRMLLGSIAVMLCIPALAWADAPPGTIVYVEDEFLPDQDMNGWTTYGNATMHNPAGNGFSLFNPTYRTDDQDGIVGIQEGGGGGRSFGMYKRFFDEYIPEGEKHIQA